MKPVKGLIRTVLGGTAIAGAAGIWMAVAGTDLESHDVVVNLDINGGGKTLAFVVDNGKGRFMRVNAAQAEGCEVKLRNCFWVESLSPENLQDRLDTVARKAREVYADYYHAAGLEPNIGLLQLETSEINASHLPALKQALNDVGQILGRTQYDLEPLDAAFGDKHSDTERQAAYEAALKDARAVSDIITEINNVERLKDVRTQLVQAIPNSGELGYDEAEYVSGEIGVPFRAAEYNR